MRGIVNTVVIGVGVGLGLGLGVSATTITTNSVLNGAITSCGPTGRDCDPTYGPMNSWDTSTIDDFSSLFESKADFNADISGWDTSSVTDMYYTFYGASQFNVDISNWDVANVVANYKMISMLERTNMSSCNKFLINASFSINAHWHDATYPPHDWAAHDIADADCSAPAALVTCGQVKKLYKEQCCPGTTTNTVEMDLSSLMT